jgi:acyl carrier protein
LSARPPDEIDLDKDLADLGLDSVDAVLMAGEMEQAFGIEIDPAEALRHPTVEAMLAFYEPLIAAN